MSLSVPGEGVRLVLERDNFLVSLTEAARGLPGAVTCSIFGSLVEGRGNAWSDLDIEIVTTDVEASLDCLFPTLANVHPLEIAWIIDSRPNAWAASVVFQEASLFHKVDLGIRSMHVIDQNPVPRPSILSWSQGAHLRTSCPERATLPFMPEPGSGQHVLLGHLLGITRYAKARKRDNLATCWRFASALADAVFAACYRTAGSETPLQGRLGTMEYLALDTQVPCALSPSLMSALNFSSPEAMDQAVYLLMHELVDAFGRGSNPHHIPAPILEKFNAFAIRELAIP